MAGRQSPVVAREGIAWLVLMLVAVVAIARFLDPIYATIPAALFVWLFFVFRDPNRNFAAVPLGIISPVDGTVESVEQTSASVLGGDVQRILIRVNSFGTYTARCPVEGKVMDIHGEGRNEVLRRFSAGLWVETDEGHDVVLQFHGSRFGLVPLAFVRFGERIGQGQRCAFLRLARQAEIQFPASARVLVTAGQRITAGTELLGKLPPH